MRANPSDEELLVRYLLGDLPEETQAEIEDRAFQDREYLQEILAAESDLIDEYVRGGLSDSRRRLFDSRFLASAERRQKVEFAKALANVLSETAVAEKESVPVAARAQVSGWNSFAAFLRGLSPVIRFSLVAAALLIVASSLWMIIETVRLRSQITELQAQQQTQQRDQVALKGQLADEQARSEGLSSQLQNERGQREISEELIRELEREREASATRPIQPAVLSLVLMPGIARGGRAHPKLDVPQSARLVRVQVGIEPEDEYKSFSVEIRSPKGEIILNQNGLPARTMRAGRAIVLNLPAKPLGAGQYELALKGITDGGKTEDVGYYYFDVVKK